MASLQVDAAPVEEVKSQAEPATNISSDAKEPEVHELDESIKRVDPNVEDHKETLEIHSDDEEEEEKEMESLVNEEEDFSPFTSVEPPPWPAEFNEEEDEEEEEDEFVYKV